MCRLVCGESSVLLPAMCVWSMPIGGECMLPCLTSLAQPSMGRVGGRGAERSSHGALPDLAKPKWRDPIGSYGQSECGCCMQEGRGERRSADAYVLCLDGCRPITPSHNKNGGSQRGGDMLD